MKRIASTLILLVTGISTVLAGPNKTGNFLSVFGTLVLVIGFGSVISFIVPRLVYEICNKIVKEKRKNFTLSFLTGFVVNLLLIGVLASNNNIDISKINAAACVIFYTCSYIIFCLFGFYISPKKKVID